MEQKYQMFGVWSGVALLVVFGIALLLFMQWIPPTAPSLGADEIASIFRERSVSIRIGAVMLIVAAALYLPWTVMISDLIRQTEGKSFFLSGSQLAGGISAQLTFFLSGYLWAVAAFRPERAPEITQIFSDLAWLIFITVFAPFVVQNLAIAASIFDDKRTNPTFPRWVAFLQLWVAVSFFPAVLAFFMKTGPFAWNGLFCFWLPLTMFSTWFAVMIWFCRAAILRGDDCVD